MLKASIQTCCLSLFFALFFCIQPRQLRAQTNDVEFVIGKIISDYPGYKEKTKGMDFPAWAHEIARQNSNDTFKALALIVEFFLDDHLRIVTPRKNVLVDSIACQMRLSDITRYLSKPGKSPREGYWMNDYNNCLIALRQVSRSPATFEATVIEENAGFLKPGQAFARMEAERNGSFFTYQVSPHTGAAQYLSTDFRNDTVFIAGATSKWRKIRDYAPGYLKRFQPESDVPVGLALDSSTYLLTIPICLQKNIAIVDSILRVDSAKIASRENLIVDIRRNVGGRADIYDPLLPWIYTNPIDDISSRTYVTDSSLAHYNKYIDGLLKFGPLLPEEDSLVFEMRKFYAENKGSFGPLYENCIEYPEIRSNPKKVGLIMNYGCQSAAEMLILTFLQSRKVTSFGEQTHGAVDYLSYYPQETASKKYRLYLPISRREFGPGGALDRKGIAPMVRISDNEPDWVGYVQAYLKKKNDAEQQPVLQ